MSEGGAAADAQQGVVWRVCGFGHGSGEKKGYGSGEGRRRLLSQSVSFNEGCLG